MKNYCPFITDRSALNRIITSLATATLFVLLIQCGKESEPAPASQCEVNFAGKKYTLDVVVGCNTDKVSAGSSGGSTSDGPLLALDKTIDYIRFKLDMSVPDEDDYTNLTGNTSGSVSYSNGKWTFSGTLEDLDGNTEDISGSCTCTQK